MSDVLAVVPARMGSKGIPGKNFAPLAGRSPVDRAIDAVNGCGWTAIVSTDAALGAFGDYAGVVSADHVCPMAYLQRPIALAQDGTPMIAVVRHVLEIVPGKEDQIVLLVQPTQPLRQPKHLTAAIELLRETQADSVVSVVETESPWRLMRIEDGRLHPWDVDAAVERRQDAPQAYKRDGTVYAFWRYTVSRSGTIYGRDVRPLIIPASETCPLDTPEDWAEAERRLKALEG